MINIMQKNVVHDRWPEQHFHPHEFFHKLLLNYMIPKDASSVYKDLLKIVNGKRILWQYCYSWIVCFTLTFKKNKHCDVWGDGGWGLLENTGQFEVTRFIDLCLEIELAAYEIYMYLYNIVQTFYKMLQITLILLSCSELHHTSKFNASYDSKL